MGEGEADERRFQWWCAYCDRRSGETFDSKREAHDAGLAHLGEAGHGLTTILTPEAE